MDLQDKPHFGTIEQRCKQTVHQDTYRMALHNLTWVCTILCFAQVWPMPTTCKLQGHLVETTHNLLENMGGHFPLQCLQENVLIALPKSAFESNETTPSISVDKAIYETLKDIDSLFENDGIPNSWDGTKLEDFQNIVYRQIEESKCIMSNTQEIYDFPAREAALKTYFKKMATVLKEKDFSFCAWEIVRKELLRLLQFILEHNRNNLLWPRRT